MRARLEPQAGEVHRQAQCPEHQVGAVRGVGNHVKARAERADQDADDDRAACQAEFYGQADARDAYGDAPEREPEDQADEDCHEVGLFEVFHGVAEYLFHMLDRCGFTHDRQAVAHLQTQVGCGQQLHARTVDAADVDAVGVLRVLEAVRVLGLTKKTKVYQASTSELYGKVEEVPQSETTPFHPYSPYAIAKQYGFWMIKEYREAYGMFAVNGILFNHESERRGENFVTRKITLAAGRIAEGLQDHLELGNLDSLRDWGYAKDYVECMWLIMQQEKPEDFVIATGEQHTVRDFTQKAFAANGITLRWEGAGIDEKGYDAATGKMLVCVNPQWFRPTDVDNLWGNPAKAKTVLGWNPQKTSYEELVKIMAEHDRELAKREKALLK